MVDPLSDDGVTNRAFSSWPSGALDGGSWRLHSRYLFRASPASSMLYIIMKFARDCRYLEGGAHRGTAILLLLQYIAYSSSSPYEKVLVIQLPGSALELGDRR